MSRTYRSREDAKDANDVGEELGQGAGVMPHRRGGWLQGCASNLTATYSLCRGWGRVDRDGGPTGRVPLCASDGEGVVVVGPTNGSARRQEHGGRGQREELGKDNLDEGS